MALNQYARFYEMNFRGQLYSAGSGPTALSANTIGLTATATPIVGVYNPTGSGISLSIQMIKVSAYFNTLTTPTGPGAFVLASSVGNTAVATGVTPFNRKTLAAGGLAKAFNGGVALTGLTNNLVVFEGLEMPTYGPLTYSTTTAGQLGGAIDIEIDGSIIVPAGGVLAVLNTTSTTTVTVTSAMIWEEVPN
jgi:hypothetical protein